MTALKNPFKIPVTFLFWGYTYLVLRGALTVATDIPDLPFQINDKLMHTIEFFISYPLARLYFSSLTQMSRLNVCTVAVLYGILLAALSEVFQYRVAGRSSSWGDFCADLIGIGAAVLISAWIQASRIKRDEKGN